MSGHGVPHGVAESLAAPGDALQGELRGVPLDEGGFVEPGVRTCLGMGIHHVWAWWLRGFSTARGNVW